MAEWIQGRVVASWCNDGRQMFLDESVSFRDSFGVIWEAPAGAVIDGASIPRFFWRVVGGPFEGKYRRASVVHDWHCAIRVRPSRDVHRVFREMCRASGCGRVFSFLLWAAVRVFGPRFCGCA